MLTQTIAADQQANSAQASLSARDLKRAISRIKSHSMLTRTPAVGSASTIQELQSVRLRTMQDLVIERHALEASVRITVAAQARGNMDVQIKLQDLADALKSVPVRETVCLSQASDGVTLTTGGMTVRFTATSGGASFPQEVGTTIINADGAKLADAVGAAVTHASADGDGSVLCAARLASDEHGAQIVATDRYRLVERTLPGAIGSFHVNIPARMLGLAVKGAKAGEQVRILQGAEHVYVDRPGELWGIQPTVGQWPQRYRALFPDVVTGRVRVDGRELVACARSAASIIRRAHHPMRIEVDMEAQSLRLSVEMQGAERYSQTIPAIVDRDLAGLGPIGVLPTYLADAITATPAEMIVLALTAPHRPIMLEGAQDARAIVMPIRLDA